MVAESLSSGRRWQQKFYIQKLRWLHNVVEIDDQLINSLKQPYRVYLFGRFRIRFPIVNVMKGWCEFAFLTGLPEHLQAAPVRDIALPRDR